MLNGMASSKTSLPLQQRADTRNRTLIFALQERRVTTTTISAKLSQGKASYANHYTNGPVPHAGVEPAYAGWKPADLTRSRMGQKELVEGIGPSLPAYKTGVLPLYDTSLITFTFTVSFSFALTNLYTCATVNNWLLSCRQQSRPFSDRKKAIMLVAFRLIPIGSIFGTRLKPLGLYLKIRHRKPFHHRGNTEGFLSRFCLAQPQH